MSEPTLTTPANSKKTTPKKKDYIVAVGRRKSATARVRLYPKKGSLTVNDKSIDTYFPGKMNAVAYLAPFRLTGTENKFSASIKVSGSGVKGQLNATIHGIARALSTYAAANRKPLKEHGLLTRDPRERERRKVGMGGKARRKKQSPKR